MESIKQRILLVMWHWLCLCLCISVTSCSDDDSVSLPNDEPDTPSTSLKVGFNYSTETPDADKPLVITFKAGADSPLYDYQGEVYLHTGVIIEDVWEYVPAEWDKNIPKCKMSKQHNNVWSLRMEPTIRQWFNSGETPVVKLGFVVRSADGTKKGIQSDTFVEVTDTKYTSFVPAAIKYKTMPADVQEGINIQNPTTVTLVLYDKDSQGYSHDFAHVVGDFNHWKLTNDEHSKMYRDDSKGCWWITLTDLDPAKEYAFQYYIGTKEPYKVVRIADAYAEKILDPDNDSFIPTTTYNEPKIYPTGGRGIVATFRTQKTAYQWKVNDFKLANPDKMVIYELLLRDFTASKDLKGAMERLDYLKAMGINAIELMPVQEFDGNDSWGYNPCFYFAMDKAYGTDKQYKEFIDACHQRGIGVVLDVVYNHATGNHPFAKLYWDSKNNKTAPNNPYFNVDAPHPYSVFHDFNHQCPLVRKFVKRNLQFLLKEYHLDGFRFDLTKGFTQRHCNENNLPNYDSERIAVLKEYGEAIHQVNPAAYVILEHFCDYKEEDELRQAGLHLWRNCNDAYCQSAMGWKERSSFKGAYEKNPGWVAYMESHDEERTSYKQSQWGNGPLKSNLQARMEQLALNAAFFLTVPGPKMIWQFGEMGYDVSIEEGGRTACKPLHWEYLDNQYRKQLHDTYTYLINLRNQYPELFESSTALQWTVEERDWDMGRTIQLKSLTGKELIVLGNFKNETATVNVPSQIGPNWKVYPSSKSMRGNGQIQIPAHHYYIYTNF